MRIRVDAIVSDPIERRGEWWQELPDGSWIRWNESASQWERQEFPPPPPEDSGGDSTSAPEEVEVASKIVTQEQKEQPLPPPPAATQAVPGTAAVNPATDEGNHSALETLSKEKLEDPTRYEAELRRISQEASGEEILTLATGEKDGQPCVVAATRRGLIIAPVGGVGRVQMPSFAEMAHLRAKSGWDASALSWSGKLTRSIIQQVTQLTPSSFAEDVTRIAQSVHPGIQSLPPASSVSSVGSSHQARPTTPPGIEHRESQQAQYAGFWLRFVAAVIDAVIVWVGTYVLGYMMGSMMIDGYSTEDEIAGALLFINLAGLLANWLYFALQESSAAQATPGKRAMGLRVTDEYGDRISFGKASGRYFGKIISGLIIGIGFLMAGWTEKKQALHDMMAGTLVIK